MRNGKQFSFWHVLPKSKTELQTLMPRKLLQDKKFISDYSVKTDFALLCFLLHMLSNAVKSNKDAPVIEIKRSTLRNFIGKKIHSKRSELLDMAVESFLDTLSCSTVRTLSFDKKGKKIVFSLENSFFKSILSGNTVSFNLYEFTSIRGEKAKKLFLSILCFDLRLSERYSKFSNLVNYLDISFTNRENSISKIKRAFNSLDKKGFIKFGGYDGKVKKGQRYIFNYSLMSLKQL